MRGIDGEQMLVRVFLGEAKMVDGRPLHRQLLDLFRQEGLAGATVLKGCAGFGPARVVRTTTVEYLAQDLPVVIEVVDSPGHVETLLARLDQVMTGGLVTVERARVLRYDPGPPGGRAGPEGRPSS